MGAQKPPTDHYTALWGAAQPSRTVAEPVLRSRLQADSAQSLLGGKRYALRRTAILPALFTPEKRPLRSDPNDDPYAGAHSLTYHAAWTAPLFRALSFVIRVMCVDTEEELHTATAELIRSHDSPKARAAFDDMSLVTYSIVKEEIAPALSSGDPLREVALQNRLVSAFKQQYEHVTELARRGE